MAKEVHYTVQRQKKLVYGYLYEVFADDENGADEFKEKAEEYQAVPGSYIDVASKSVGYLLMNDGTWEEHEPIGINGWGSGGGGGGKIPEVDSSDNGKFLRVVDGEWAAVSVPDANGEEF